jgi:hopanoid biosynthesis associated protein HpnK
MRKIIINADDLGLCRPVNEGIIEAHRRGVLTSATLMTNTPGFAEAVALARDNPGLGVGVHLNLVRGRPLSPPAEIPTLLGPDGRFLTEPFRILRRLSTGRIRPAEVERELRAQVEKALATGLPLTHLDSEKHMHVLPPVFRIVIRLAGEYGIRKVRYIREVRLARRPAQAAKAAYLSACCRLMRGRVRAAGLVITDAFYGICNSGRMTANVLRRVLERAGEGSSEIMVHPGFQTPELFEVEGEVGPYYINRFREAEFKALLDPGLRDVVRARDLRLVNFNGI